MQLLLRSDEVSGHVQHVTAVPYRVQLWKHLHSIYPSVAGDLQGKKAQSVLTKEQWGLSCELCVPRAADTCACALCLCVQLATAESLCCDPGSSLTNEPANQFVLTQTEAVAVRKDIRNQTWGKELGRKHSLITSSQWQMLSSHSFKMTFYLLLVYFEYLWRCLPSP